MRKYPGIPELLETYMMEKAADERWVTVQELRDRFGMSRYESRSCFRIPAPAEVRVVRSVPIYCAQDRTY